jgi:hypothetical protein
MQFFRRGGFSILVLGCWQTRRKKGQHGLCDLLWVDSWFAMLAIMDALQEGAAALGWRMSDHVITHEFQRGTLVPFRLDQNIEDLALSIDGAPKIDHAAIDFQIESSGPGELHPQALTDPDVSVSTHPAPTVQPLPGIAVSNVQKVLAPDA